MKIYLIAVIYFLEPGADSPIVVPQGAMEFDTQEACEQAGSRYKYLIEGIRGYEFQYKCVAFGKRQEND
jgi:hypothetical protein